MSQAKVDKYKESKKNRQKEIKQKKVKKAFGYVIGALIIGCAIGFPAGKQIYKVSEADRKAKATINSDIYTLWMQDYWANTYLGIAGGYDDATATDADMTELPDELSGDNVKVLDEDTNTDDLLNEIIDSVE